MSRSDDLHVLLVDDDPRFRQLMVAGFTEYGVKCTAVENGAAALAELQGQSADAYQVILLDVMMPMMDGIECLRRIRAEFGTPVLFVTAVGAIDDRVKGLRLGADDYIVKPFAFAELLARVEAAARRGRRPAILSCGELRLDLGRRQAWHGDTPLGLSPKEFSLLHALVERRGLVVERADLLREVWQMDFDPESNVVDVHVARLRRKLQLAHGIVIETVRGRGYRLRNGREGRG